MAKYSYMPTDQFRGKSTVDDKADRGYGYFIDSDLRLLEFCNQYDEKFVLLSADNLRWIVIIVTAFGFLAGRYLP